MREKAALEKQTQESLKRVEAEFQLELLKKDQLHQISKPTFEAIFNKKIELYSELLSICIGIRQYLDEGDYSGKDDRERELFYFQCKIKTLIGSHRLYVSNDLFAKYSIWHYRCLPHLKDINWVDYARESPKYPGSIMDDVGVYIHQSPLIEKLVNSTHDSFLEVISQIEKDIDLLRNSIDLPILDR